MSRLPAILRNVALLMLLSPGVILAQEPIPDQVLDVFYDRCAFSGCHAGPNPASELDLTEEFALASLVNQPSKDHSDIMRVKPQDPQNSYLMMKLRGAPEISGERMPRSGDPLTAEQMAAIESWINSLPPGTKTEAPQQEYVEAFPGISVATLPTTETIPTGRFSYRIAHRWRGAVDRGFAHLFGLDDGARMLTQLTFPITNDILVYASRSEVNATFEFGGKWRLLREKTDGSVPLSIAVIGGLDWATRKNIIGVPTSRTDSERFSWFAQVALSKHLHDRISVLLVPGVLANGNVGTDDEDTVLSLGFAAKFMIVEDFSFFVEGVPLLSGQNTAAPVDLTGDVFYDAFTLGLERKIGGHVFHVYITNSLGLTTNQYMSGGDFDFSDGDFRLGFNIYRLLGLPF